MTCITGTCNHTLSGQTIGRNNVLGRILPENNPSHKLLTHVVTKWSISPAQSTKFMTDFCHIFSNLRVIFSFPQIHRTMENGELCLESMLSQKKRKKETRTTNGKRSVVIWKFEKTHGLPCKNWKLVINLQSYHQHDAPIKVYPILCLSAGVSVGSRTQLCFSLSPPGPLLL